MVIKLEKRPPTYHSCLLLQTAFKKAPIQLKKTALELIESILYIWKTENLYHSQKNCAVNCNFYYASAEQ